MTEAVLSVGIASFVVGVASLIVGAFTLWNARRSMELAEDCMEYLREEQARLLVFLREERRIPQEEAEQEREQYLETRRRTGRLSRERLLPRQEQAGLAEELERERAQTLWRPSSKPGRNAKAESGSTARAGTPSRGSTS